MLTPTPQNVRILSGTREINARQAKVLAARFSVSVAAFI